MAASLPDAPSLVFLISGPAGSGKTTLCDAMLAEFAGGGRLQRVVTATTREPREGEVDGVDYYFLSPKDFEAKVEAGEFFENAQVFQHRYGILKAEIHGKLRAGIDTLVNIDVQGAATFRQRAEEDRALRGKLVTVFIMPPDHEELRRRLVHRGQNDAGDIEHRLEVASREMEEWIHYHYVIRSGAKDADFASMHAIYRAEKMRVRPGDAQT